MAAEQDAGPGLALTTDDHHPLWARPLRVSDKPHLQEGLTRLSRQSRYYRFLTGIERLSEAQLRELTEFDRETQEAWVVFDAAADTVRGVAVGRFVVDPADRTRAEVALVVVDAFQNRGVGRRVLGVLTVCAARHGVLTFTGLASEDNTPVRRWFDRLGARFESDNRGAFEFVLPLSRPGLLDRLLAPRPAVDPSAGPLGDRETDPNSSTPPTHRR